MLRNWKLPAGAGILALGVAFGAASTFAFTPPAEEETATPADPEPAEADEAGAGEADIGSVWDGVFTAEQADRAWDAYNAECAQCHGNTLRGTPGGPRIVGSSFRRNWEGQTVADFYTWFHGNMPAGRGGQLPTSTYADLLALIFQENGYPAGEAAFDPELDLWAEVLIVPDPATE